MEITVVTYCLGLHKWHQLEEMENGAAKHQSTDLLRNLRNRDFLICGKLQKFLELKPFLKQILQICGTGYIRPSHNVNYKRAQPWQPISKTSGHYGQ